MRSTAAVHEDLPNLRWSNFIRSYTPTDNKTHCTGGWVKRESDSQKRSVSSSGTVCGHVTAISFPSMWWLKSNIKGRLLTITQRETSIGHIWILQLLSFQSSLQAINLLDFSSDDFQIIKEWVSCEGKHEIRGTHCGVTLHWQKSLAELVDQ